MNLIKVLNLFILITTVKSQSIQVYETVDDSLRKPKQLNNYKKFNIFTVAQPDLQKWRYFQQQSSDILKNSRKQPVLKKREIRIQRQNNLYPIHHNINFGLNHAENLKLLQHNFASPQTDQINALNSLIGQTPSVQLKGLHQLLQQKDHTPIIENTIDVTNPNTHPNVKVEYATQTAIEQAQKSTEDKMLAIAQLEKQLNAAAQLQAQEALANAQQQAFEQVEAQHRALAAAHVEAQKAALKKAQTQAVYSQTISYQPIIVQQEPIKQIKTVQSVNYQPNIVQHEPAKQIKTVQSVNYQPNIFQHEPIKQIKTVHQESKGNLQYASQYAFGYQVRDYHSKNNFGHQEIREGKTAKGHYHVLLPDGRKQNVEYWADHTGFHAKVTYDKIAKHPIH